MILTRPKIRLSAIALIIILCLWLTIFVIYLSLPTGEYDMKEKFAQMGDAFGILNSLVGAITIGFALYSIGQQNEMIKKHDADLLKDRSLARDKITLERIEIACTQLAEFTSSIARYITNTDPSVSRLDVQVFQLSQITAIGSLTVLLQIHATNLYSKAEALQKPISEANALLTQIHVDRVDNPGLPLRNETEKHFKHLADKVSQLLRMVASLHNDLLFEAKRIQQKNAS